MKHYDSINVKLKDGVNVGGSRDYKIKSYNDFLSHRPNSLNNIEDFKDALFLLNKSLQSLESVNEKGFVNSTEVRDYPMVGDLVDEFVNYNKPGEPESGFKKLEL